LIDRAEKKDGAVIVHKTFSLDSDPYLKDHSISGTPLVPGVMGLELFAETLKAAGKPSHSFKRVRFALPVKLLRLKAQAVRSLLKSGKNGPELELESDFLTPAGVRLGAPRQHFTAVPEETAPVAVVEGLDRPKAPLGVYAVSKAAVYEAYFHGPSFQVLDGIVRVGEEGVLAVYKRPAQGLGLAPAKPSPLAQPLLIEAAFQACGYRDLHVAKKMTLPDAAARVAVLQEGTAPEFLFVQAKYLGADEEGRSLYDAVVYDIEGTPWVELQGYRMIPVQ
jgi:hypothetical protein